jgi:ligand-binding SRPBCC domain-containing protein
MAITTLKTTQFLPVSIEEAWNFFSAPQNLNDITPPGMSFAIRSEVPARMYEGLFIIYTLTPVLNIPVTWITEITHVNEPFYFVDEQRRGPYRLWHHEHHFRAVPGGVEMTDILHYDVGKGIFGRIASAIFVDKKVKNIFQYREKKLLQLFGN